MGTQRREEGGERFHVRECDVLAEEREAAIRVCHREHLKKEPAEQTGQHANREEEGWPAGHPTLAIKRGPNTNGFFTYGRTAPMARSFMIPVSGRTTACQRFSQRLIGH
jgi:hypothetical protein